LENELVFAFGIMVFVFSSTESGILDHDAFAFEKKYTILGTDKDFHFTSS